MPRVKRTRRRPYRKRSARKSRKGSRGKKVMVSKRTPWPNAARTRLGYSRESNLLIPNSASGDYVEYRMNSITDPLTAVTGDYGPLGAPEWGKFYTKYTVTGVKVTLTAWPQLVNDESQYEGFIYIHFLASTATASAQLKQDASGTVLSAATIVPNLPNIRYQRVSGVHSDRRPYVLTAYRSVASVEGKSPRSVTTDDDYSGTIGPTGAGDDPVTEPKFLVGYAAHQNGNSTPDAVWRLQTDVKYYVRFHGANFPTSVLIST